MGRVWKSFRAYSGTSTFSALRFVYRNSRSKYPYEKPRLDMCMCM